MNSQHDSEIILKRDEASVLDVPGPHFCILLLPVLVDPNFRWANATTRAWAERASGVRLFLCVFGQSVDPGESGGGHAAQ